MGNLFAEREASLRTRRGRPNPQDEGRRKAISPPQEMGVTHSGNAKENEATRPLSLDGRYGGWGNKHHHGKVYCGCGGGGGVVGEGTAPLVIGKEIKLISASCSAISLKYTIEVQTA